MKFSCMTFFMPILGWYKNISVVCINNEKNIVANIGALRGRNIPWEGKLLVFGESKSENKRNSIYREYRLGNDKVQEKTQYDRVGFKAITNNEYSEKIIEKVKKGRKTLNATSGLGLRRGGLPMKTCSLMFWIIVVPIVTYAFELWIMGEKEIEILDSSQRYSGRRIQRFHPRS